MQVDWKKVEKDVNKAKKHLKKRANKAAPELNSFIEEVGILRHTNGLAFHSSKYGNVHRRKGANTQAFYIAFLIVITIQRQVLKANPIDSWQLR